MDDEGKYLAFVLIAIIGLSLFGTYTLGRRLERRDYTNGFVKQVEAAYWEGFDDGRKPVQVMK